MSQCPGALLAVVRVVLPAKGHMRVGDVEDAVVGDGHAVGIAGQVVQNVFRAAEGRFGIHHPLFPEQRAQERVECLLVRQRKTRAVESQLLLAESPAKASHELTAKDAAQDLYGQEEPRR